jgi:hypothetical protein
MDLLKAEPGSCNVTCQTTSHNVTGIQVENFTVLKEEEKEPVISPVLKAESDVSCLCVECCACFINIWNFLPLNQFFLMEHFNYDKCILNSFCDSDTRRFYFVTHCL